MSTILGSVRLTARTVQVRVGLDGEGRPKQRILGATGRY